MIYQRDVKGRFVSAGGGRQGGGIGIGFRVRTRDDIPRLLRKARRQNIRTLGHAAAVIRVTAKRSIRKRAGPSPAGQPPHTHCGVLPRSLRYAVARNRQSAVIGPDYTVARRVGRPHEKGGIYFGRRYPARPYMLPAFEKIRPRLPRFWGGSIR